jgi:hypothetical protein
LGGVTSINFIDPDHGWIANCCSRVSANPVIVRTDDGGRTWQKMRVPDVADTTISGSVQRIYGAVIEVRFLNPKVGWYLQGGDLWNTANGGTTWKLTGFTGVVRDIETSGDNAWALVNDCPTDSIKTCTYFRIYHRTSDDPTWRSLSKALSAGASNGAVLVAHGNTASVYSAGGLYSATGNGALLAVDQACEPVGTLTPGKLVGICDDHGGGNASLTSFDVSSDGGRHWDPFVDGPPSQGWEGARTTNGAGALFYVTGGTTLWRTDSVSRNWTPVFQTIPNSTDEIYPLYFADTNDGFMFESGSSGVHLLASHDAGLTWNAVTLP